MDFTYDVQSSVEEPLDATRLKRSSVAFVPTQPTFDTRTDATTWPPARTVVGETDWNVGTRSGRGAADARLTGAPGTRPAATEAAKATTRAGMGIRRRAGTDVVEGQPTER